MFSRRRAEPPPAGCFFSCWAQASSTGMAAWVTAFFYAVGTQLPGFPHVQVTPDLVNKAQLEILPNSPFPLQSSNAFWPLREVTEKGHPLLPWKLQSKFQSESASCSVMLRPHGLYWNSPDQNTGVGSLSLSSGSSWPWNRTRSTTLALVIMLTKASALSSVVLAKSLFSKTL